MADTFKPAEPIEPYEGMIDLSRPHFVGIGGTAMSSVALMASAAGSVVSGSDAQKSDRTKDLILAGIDVMIGNAAGHIEGASCVVYTTVTSGTPEVAAAKVDGIPVVHRAEVLSQLCADKRLVGVIGSHGKSSTTAMLATSLAKLDYDLTFMVGAPLLGSQSIRIGDSDLVVAEIDESDRSFLLMDGAEVLVVTTLNEDHPETYAQEGDYFTAFADYSRRLAPNGTLIANADDPGVVALVECLIEERPDVAVFTYGKAEGADWKIQAINAAGWQQTIEVEMPQGGTLCLDLCSPAVHFGHNAVGALAAAVALGAEPSQFAKVLATFGGVGQRFQRYGTRQGVTIVGSFASHPYEIAADLVTAKTLAGSHSVVVAFQPSGYGRIQKYGKTIGHVLAAGADAIFVLPAHGVGEPEGVTSQIVADAISEIESGGLCSYPDADSSAIKAAVREGDILVLMGTGDLSGLLTEVMEALATPLKTPFSTSA